MELDPITANLQQMLANTVAANEAERVEAAERDAAAFADLEQRLAEQQASAEERESALLDIVSECRAGIMAVLDMDPDHAIETACPLRIRTIAARAETALRLAGRA